MTDTTLDLLAKAHHGDSAALAEFVQHFRPRLRQWAHNRLPSWSRSLADTDDLVQDVLLRTMQRLPVIETNGEAGLEFYLRRALLNRVREEIRRARPAAALHVELSDTVPSSAPSPFDETQAHESRARYDRALETLDHDDRLAIVARFELGYSFAEMAGLLSKRTPDAARKHTERAVLLLAARMRPTPT